MVWVKQVTANKLKFSALGLALQYLAAAPVASFCLLLKRIWLDRCCLQTFLRQPTHFAVTLSNVYTAPDSLPSFAEECSFGNWSSVHTTKKTVVASL